MQRLYEFSFVDVVQNKANENLIKQGYAKIRECSHDGMSSIEKAERNDHIKDEHTINIIVI